jgi:hypothetical protein
VGTFQEGERLCSRQAELADFVIHVHQLSETGHTDRRRGARSVLERDFELVVASLHEPTGITDEQTDSERVERTYHMHGAARLKLEGKARRRPKRFSSFQHSDAEARSGLFRFTACLLGLSARFGFLAVARSRTCFELRSREGPQFADAAAEIEEDGSNRLQPVNQQISDG